MKNRKRRVLAVRCSAWPPGDWSAAGNRTAGSSGDRSAGSPGAWTAGQSARQHVSQEVMTFEQVVNAVEEFCPQIEVLRPGICVFGARGPARYFGGEEELARKVTESVTRLGFENGVGIADSLFAALLAARDATALTRPTDAAAPAAPAAPTEPTEPTALIGPVLIVPPGVTPAFLAPRSVTVLGEPELTDLLVRLGIRTLGEFAALSAAEVGNRFGPPGLLAHRLARGLDPRPLIARPPSVDLSVQIEFDPPVEQSEPVVFAAKSLAGQMHARLAASGLGCVRLQVQVVCEDGQEITRWWRHDGLLSELAVAERVRWQLDGWQAAAGVTMLRLIPDQVVHDQGRQLGLWGDAVVSDRVARAAIRVQAMLGHGAVRQPVLVGGRSPADQAVLVPFGDSHFGDSQALSQPSVGPAGRPADRPADRPWPGQIPPPAPATVYPTPRPAMVVDGSGRLVIVTGRGQVSADPARLSVADGPSLAVTAWTGPWPVTERWWDPVNACRKARFQLVTTDGSAWLAVVQDGRWLIEAAYD